MTKENYFPEWINEAEKLYKENLPYYKIAKELNINRKTISFYLRKKGYQSNPKYVRNVDRNKLRKYDYSYAEHIFEKIDSEEKAYWLGFLYADGHISSEKNEVALCLKKEDKTHVERFRSFFKLDAKKLFVKKKTINDKNYYSYRFALTNENIKNDLIKLGCLPRKTFILVFPSKKQVPEKYIKHFLRGYIDGDGCITTSKTSKISLEILGTEKFLKGCLDWINIAGAKIYSFNHSEIKRIIFSGKNAVRILDEIYKNAHVFLERKHEKYLSLRRLVSKSA